MICIINPKIQVDSSIRHGDTNHPELRAYKIREILEQYGITIIENHDTISHDFYLLII